MIDSYFTRSLEQFIQIVKGRNDCFYRSNAIKVPTGTNNWNVKTYRNKLKNVLTDESKMFDSGWGYALIVLKRLFGVG